MHRTRSSSAASPRLAAGLDPIRDEARACAAALAKAGVEVVFQEAAGNIHGFATLRRAIPSSAEDVARALAAARTLLPLRR